VVWGRCRDDEDVVQMMEVLTKWFGEDAEMMKMWARGWRR